MSAESAEHYAEMAAEAETKKEAAHYWRLYREAMAPFFPDGKFPRRPPVKTNKPSKALVRTILSCPCKAGKFTWSRVVAANGSATVQLSCKCGRQTNLHVSNSAARDEWNKSIEKQGE